MHDISEITENCHHAQRVTSVMTFHVFVIDVIMFTKCIVVSRYCIFDMNVYYLRRDSRAHILVGYGWVMVGTLLGDGWCNVG